MKKFIETAVVTIIEAAILCGIGYLGCLSINWIMEILHI